MQKKRTQIDFSNHSVFVKKTEDISIYHIKKTGTHWDSVKFINTNGVLVVTGDYGNWIFDREFHPSADSYVVDPYWNEKARISSSQVLGSFDGNATHEAIKEIIDNDNDLSDVELVYLNELLLRLEDELEYTCYAYRENVGRFEDCEFVPFVKSISPQLEAVYDAFDEICIRYSKGFSFFDEGGVNG